MRREGRYNYTSDWRMETNLTKFEGGLEAFTLERDNLYVNSKLDGQWRWKMNGSKSNLSNSMASHVFNKGQKGDASRSYFQGLRPDPKLTLQNQSSNDARSQAHEEDTDVRYQTNHSSHTFEHLERKFLDEILNLAKEQNDAEDLENDRHKEKLNAINAQYEEKLAEIRALHVSRRDEFLQRESHAMQHQYQQIVRDTRPSNGMAPDRNPHPHGYNSVNVSATVGNVRRGYFADHFDPYRERVRFLGSSRYKGLEPRGPY